MRQHSTLLTKVIFVFHFLIQPVLGQNNPTVTFHALTLYNKNLKQFISIDDSNEMLIYDLQKQLWKTKKLVYEVVEPFDFFKQNYVPIVAGEDIYFVYRGCGEVYLLKNDTIRRHDLSFKHRNQYGASIFCFENQICFFGGYGLFTPKNIITSYDSRLRQWFEYPSSSLNKPLPQNYAIHQIQNDQLIVTGGFNCNPIESKRINEVWKFDIRGKTWTMIGKLTDDFYDVLNTSQLIIPNEPVSLLKKNGKLFQIDFFKNKYTCYSASKIGDISHLILDDEFKFILTKITNSDLKTYSLNVIPFSKLLVVKEWEKSIYSINPNESSTWYTWPILLFFLVVIFVLIIIVILFKIFQIRREKKIQKALLWSDFDEKEQHVINLLLSCENGIEISQLNDLFGDLEIGFEALKKRREHFIKDFKFKLSEKSGFEIEELFIEFKNPNDKRIKIIQLKKSLEFKGK
jgi:hypothetical protein